MVWLWARGKLTMAAWTIVSRFVFQAARGNRTYDCWRSLERGLDPSLAATSRHLAALVYKEAARIAYIYSGHSIRIPAGSVSVRPSVLRHAEVQCASVPLVPIRAGMTTSRRDFQGRILRGVVLREQGLAFVRYRARASSP